MYLKNDNTIKQYTENSRRTIDKYTKQKVQTTNGRQTNLWKTVLDRYLSNGLYCLGFVLFSIVCLRYVVYCLLYSVPVYHLYCLGFVCLGFVPMLTNDS